MWYSSKLRDALFRNVLIRITDINSVICVVYFKDVIYIFFIHIFLISGVVKTIRFMFLEIKSLLSKSITYFSSFSLVLHHKSIFKSAGWEGNAELVNKKKNIIKGFFIYFYCLFCITHLFKIARARTKTKTKKEQKRRVRENVFYFISKKSIWFSRAGKKCVFSLLKSAEIAWNSNLCVCVFFLFHERSFFFFFNFRKVRVRWYRTSNLKENPKYFHIISRRVLCFYFWLQMCKCGC